MRILFVENDKLFGQCVCSSLKQWQHDVDWITDGMAAWASLQSKHFDLVILDLGLPGLSGDHIVENMYLNNIKIPVIVLTGNNSIDERIKMMRHGINAYLAKPFDIEELQAHIDNLKKDLVPCAKSMESSV